MAFTLETNTEEQKYIENAVGDTSDIMYAMRDGIKIDGWISYDDMAKIVDYLRAQTILKNTGFFDYKNANIQQHDFAEQSQDESTMEQVLVDMRKDFDTFCKQAEEFVLKGKQYDRK